MARFPQTYWSRQQARIIESQLAVGGEGSIHPVKGTDLVAKLYHPGKAKLRKDQIEAMCQNAPDDPSACVHPGHSTYAWPLEPLWKDASRTDFAGFLMKRIDMTRCHTLLKLATPGDRRKVFPDATWELCLRVAENLARAVHGIHEKGHRVGDLRELNLMVSQDGLVTLVDCDSFQIGSDHPCLVGTPDYLPPEMMSMDFGKTRPDRLNSDRWALAVLIWQLLMDGFHPFQAISESLPQGISREEKISRGLTPLCDKDLEFPPMAPSLDVLPASLLELFRQCFGPGHSDPSLRPAALVFVQALVKVKPKVCKTNPAHVWGSKERSCPWCRLKGTSWPEFRRLINPSIECQRPLLRDVTTVHTRVGGSNGTVKKIASPSPRPAKASAPKPKAPPPSVSLPPPPPIRLNVRTPLLRKRFTAALLLSIATYWWSGRPEPVASVQKIATVPPLVSTPAPSSPVVVAAAMPPSVPPAKAVAPSMPAVAMNPTAMVPSGSMQGTVAQVSKTSVVVAAMPPEGPSLIQRAFGWTGAMWKGGLAWVMGTGRSLAAWWTRPSPVKNPDPVKVGTASVSSPGLNLRQYPNAKASLMRAMHQDERVSVLDHTGQWWKLQDSAGTIGWALGKHLELQ